MELRISDLLDELQEVPIDILPYTAASEKRVNELTLRKIHEHGNPKNHTRSSHVISKVLIAAVLITALAFTVVAATGTQFEDWIVGLEKPKEGQYSQYDSELLLGGTSYHWEVSNWMLLLTAADATENGITLEAMAYGPFVVFDVHSPVAHGNHRLYCKHHARLQLYAAAGPTEVGNVRIFVHLLADAVTAQIADYSVAVLFGMYLDRMGEIAEPVSAAGHVGADPETLFGNIYQLLILFGPAPYQHGKRAVRLPAVKNDAAVYGEQLTLFERFVIGKTVYHLVVNRCADRERKALIAIERRDAARRADQFLRHLIQMVCGDPGLDALLDLGYWIVVIPGFISALSASSTLFSRAPALRIFSIWLSVLIVIMRYSSEARMALRTSSGRLSPSTVFSLPLPE